MRTRFAVPLALAGLLVVPLTARSGGASAPRVRAFGPVEGPQLSAPEPEHDFGQVFEGANLAHTFVLRSSGTEDLVIHRVRPSCGCTVAHMWVLGPEGERTAYEEGSPLAPGAELVLETTFKTAGKKGAQAKPVQVYANIPEGSIELTIKADVRAFLRLTPERILLDRFSVREEARGSAEIRPFDGQPLRLVLPEQEYPGKLTVELEPVEPDDSGRAALWRVSVHVAKGAKEGPFHHMLQIEAPLEPEDGAAAAPGEPGANGRVGRLSIAGQVLGLVSATPNYMSFGAVRGATGTAKSIRINSNAPDIELAEPKFTLLEPREDVPYALAEHFRATAHRVEDVAGAWDVELWVGELPDEISGPFRGKLRVDFDHPQLEPLDIPFTGFHRP